MNKKLLSLAVGAALGAAPLFAQADVTLYGQANLSYNIFDGTGNSDTETDSISSNVSYLGVKGSEKLGNGMEAIFDAKWYVDYSADRSEFNAGQTIAGLKGGWGQLTAGRHEGALKVLGRKTDLFGNQAGDSRALTSAAVSDARWGESAFYTSPNMGGFKAQVGYSTGIGNAGGGGAALSEDENAWTVGATFDGGPFWVGAAYESFDTGAGSGLGDVDDWRVAGGYKFGAFNIVAHYGQAQDRPNGSDPSTWGLGGSWAFGNNTLKAQYVSLDSDQGSDDKADMWAIGIDHHMSKRVMVYAQYAKIDNDNNLGRAFGGGFADSGLTRPSVAAGEDPSVISIGTSISF